MVYTYLPFMVLPIYARLAKLDAALLEAAADLGASPFRAFLRVTLPLSLPGIAAGVALVFIPCVGEYVIPELFGGPGARLIGRVMWEEFFRTAIGRWRRRSGVAAAGDAGGRSGRRTRIAARRPSAISKSQGIIDARYWISVGRGA